MRAGQNAPAEIVAHIQGGDISINGEMLTKASTLASVANGNVVTVHSGEATLQLIDGGEVSVCGPAKFTVLASADAITLALDFGRMHVDLPASVSLRVLTPSIVATPIDIQGGKRDLVVGLDQDDSMCVLAATGAVQLEQQFSGERLIVPESGDFSLQSGQLVPVADTGQNCKCAAVPQILPATPSGSAPETASETPPLTVPQGVMSSDASPQQAVAPQQEASVGVGLLARPNDSHPVPPEKQESAVAVQPPDNAPVYKIILPPMVFSASSPAPPNVPTEETALLIREVHADPNWEFTGRVETPEFAKAMSQALGEAGPSAQSTNSTMQKKPGGFWSSLKRIFIGDRAGE
jgi:hypothetical protein